MEAWCEMPRLRPRMVVSSQALDGQYKKTALTPRTWTDRATQPFFFFSLTLTRTLFSTFDPSRNTRTLFFSRDPLLRPNETQSSSQEMMQYPLSLSALAALVPFVLAAPQQQPPPPGPPAACAPVNIIVARGSLEAQGVGLLGNIAMNTSNQIPGSIITPLVYPAQLDPYPPSVSAGVMNMTTLLNQQVQQCPQTKLVLMGYSQGAQVSLDTLCGTTDGPNFNTTAAQAPMIGSKIAAVVLFGDPTFIANQPFAKGTSKKNGIFPRQDLGPCQSLTSKFVSFCDDTDLFCASGQNLTVHLGYFSKQDYVAQASTFVVQQTK
ncbi:cutinase [Colletotrichum orchidophilum]|uniref:Cutinase n=1 Tax=Colletotrichum orchidophilum TaxID=1209926 RepID=A0A1G4AYE6_9PEZI|nr:cutinase [Colletotrichum orchidophilum]OHE94167.1 cutinase [Colletotrichum orchidophilum]